tara:strand:+ start:695 stop:1801 length:1107 start_codon:yes stop_codon:yes gene_type:complete
MILFSANSAWYLDNFRLSTFRSFNRDYQVFHASPDCSTGTSLDKFSSHVKFYANPSSVNFFKEMRALVSIAACYSKLSPDVVFSFNPKINLYSLISCKLLRIPCVPNISGVGIASQLDGITGFVYKQALKVFYRSAQHVFFQNFEDMENFKKAGLLNNVTCEVLPGSGVDLNQYRPDESPQNRRSFLMASRLIKQKGVVEYLTCARHLVGTWPEVNFSLAGVEDSSSRSVKLDVINKFCSVEGVSFLGRSDDMPALLKKIDIVVLPSYYPEGTPRSLLEAAAAGKVIITTDTPGCRDVVIEGVNGFLVPPRDTEALKETMEKVINLSDEKLAEMQANSRKLAEEKFDEQYVIQRYLDVAEEILTKKSK